MKAIKFLILIFIILPYCSYAQKDTLRGEEAKDLLRQISEQIKLDTVRLLSGAGHDACKCIDSIRLSKRDQAEISAEVAKCIDKQTILYEAMIQTNRAFKNGSTNILINTDKESNEYQSYYFRIEEWLVDSCKTMSLIVTANNKESEFSMSKNKKALDSYYIGERLIEKEKYPEALALFEKAVAIDDKFAFAWDNIGICNRRLGNLDAALNAYQRSLKLDPTGRTALHNIPVVYEYQKEYDKAIEAYNNISKIYPDDPEAYYGTGRMYEMKDDYEKALDYMCKAYNAYIAMNSAYRVDAQNNIGIYYRKLKSLGKEDRFNQILKDNHIKTQ